MLHRQIHLTVAQLWVMLHAVFSALHRKRSNTGGLAALGQLVLAQGYAPRFDLVIQFLLVLQASNDRSELLRDGPGRSAHNLHQSLPFLVGVADDDAPVVVFTGMSAISIVGCNGRPAVVADQRGARPVRPVAGRVAGP